MPPDCKIKRQVAGGDVMNPAKLIIAQRFGKSKLEVGDERSLF